MKRALVGFLLGLCTVLLLGTVWDATWEGRPTGAELASDLDLFIREFKEQVADRASVESIYGIGSNDNGLLRLGAGRAFVQTAAPTDLSGPGALNSTAGVFVGTVLGTNEPNGTIDQGTGRFWVDTDGLDGTASTPDDNQLNAWIDTVGFVPVTTQDATASGIGAANQIYNGSFEVTDGTGLVASTTVPAGWALVLTPTLAYASVANTTEGDGLILRTTGAGAPLEGVRQTLAGLKESKTYVYSARVRPTGVGDCTLTVADGTTTASDLSTGTGAFETLQVEHTTTAVPSDVTVDLLATADLDVCDWTHVTAYEKNATVSQPGTQACFQEDGTDTNNYYVGAVYADVTGNCEVTVPGPGYIVVVDGLVWADNDGATEVGLEARLQQEGVTVATGGANLGVDNTGANEDRNRDAASATVHFININPTPGTTLTYDFEATSEGLTVDRNEGDAAGPDDTADLNENPVSSLRVILIPTR